MVTATKIRIIIENSSLENARRGTLRMLRLAIRRRIFFYAQNNFIVDFGDVVVGQRHRDWRINLLNNAQTLVTSVNAATTVPELLIIYDQISKWLR